MIRDTAITLMKGRLSRPLDTVLTDAIIAEMQAAQSRLELDPFLPWFLTTENSYETTVADEQRVRVPTDFIREVDDDALYITLGDGTKKKLTKTDKESLVYSTGETKEYALVGSYFYLSPIPNAAFRLDMIYFAKDQTLENNIENRWLANSPDLLIATAGVVIAEVYVKNSATAKLFDAMAVQERAKLIASDQARTDANREYRSED